MAHTLGVGPSTANGVGMTSIGVTLTGTTAGRHIVMITWFVHASATVTGVTCTSESNLTLIGSVQRGNVGGADYGYQMGYLSNNTGGGDKTITASFSASVGNVGIMAAEFAGGDTSGWYDSAEAGGTGSSSTPSVNITTNTANALLIGGISNASGEPTPGSGYTGITLPNIWWYDQGQYNLDAGAAGSKAFDFTLGGAADWVIKCAAFKLAGGGPPPTWIKDMIGLDMLPKKR